MNQPPQDPVLDEIRAIRHQISEQAGHDAASLVAYYLELQRQFQDRLVHTAESHESADPSAA